MDVTEFTAASERAGTLFGRGGPGLCVPTLEAPPRGKAETKPVERAVLLTTPAVLPNAANFCSIFGLDVEQASGRQSRLSGRLVSDPTEFAGFADAPDAATTGGMVGLATRSTKGVLPEPGKVCGIRQDCRRPLSAGPPTWQAWRPAPRPATRHALGQFSRTAPQIFRAPVSNLLFGYRAASFVVNIPLDGSARRGRIRALERPDVPTRC